MKKLLINSLFIFICVIPVACNKLFPTNPTPAALPSLLPTPTSTPSPSPAIPTCVWTPLSQMVQFTNSPNNYVIRNVSEWNSANNTLPIPTPPVDFSHWMVVGVGVEITCGVERPVYTSICTYPNFIEVCSGLPVFPTPIATPPTLPYATPGAVAIPCNYIAFGQILAAVPQSPLPVFFNCTPTATITP